jgi:hypothetical protein
MNTDYEIKLTKVDGSIGLFYVMSSVSEIEENDQARKLFTEAFERYEVWRDGVRVAKGPHGAGD